MDDERQASAIAKAARDGGRRRVVGAGGAGTTHLLDLVAEALDGTPVVRWNPAVEPQPGPGPGVLLADDVHLAAPGIVDRFLTATGGSPRLVTAVAGTAPLTDVVGNATLDEVVRAAADLQVNAAAIAAEHLAGAGPAVDAGARLAPVVATTVRQLVPVSAVTSIVERAADAAVRLDHDLACIARHVLRTGVTGAGTAACLLGAARQVPDTDPAQAHEWIEARGRRWRVERRHRRAARAGRLPPGRRARDGRRGRRPATDRPTVARRPAAVRRRRPRRHRTARDVARHRPGARLGDRGTVRTTVAGLHRLLERADRPPLLMLRSCG